MAEHQLRRGAAGNCDRRLAAAAVGVSITDTTCGGAGFRGRLRGIMNLPAGSPVLPNLTGMRKHSFKERISMPTDNS